MKAPVATAKQGRWRALPKTLRARTCSSHPRTGYRVSSICGPYLGIL